MTCAAAHHGGCEGRIDAHHFLKAQRIRTQFPRGGVLHGTRFVPIEKGTTVSAVDVTRSQDEIVDDPRNILPVCRRHHDLLHGARIYLEAPESVKEFCAEYGLEGWLDRYTGSPTRKNEAA